MTLILDIRRLSRGHGSDFVCDIVMEGMLIC